MRMLETKQTQMVVVRGESGTEKLLSWMPCGSLSLVQMDILYQENTLSGGVLKHQQYKSPTRPL
jgi:hypothetical protein